MKLNTYIKDEKTPLNHDELLAKIRVVNRLSILNSFPIFLTLFITLATHWLINLLASLAIFGFAVMLFKYKPNLPSSTSSKYLIFDNFWLASSCLYILLANTTSLGILPRTFFGILMVGFIIVIWLVIIKHEFKNHILKVER